MIADKALSKQTPLHLLYYQHIKKRNASGAVAITVSKSTTCGETKYTTHLLVQFSTLIFTHLIPV